MNAFLRPIATLQCGLSLLACAALSACSDEPPLSRTPYPYEAGETRIIGGGEFDNASGGGAGDSASSDGAGISSITTVASGGVCPENLDEVCTQPLTDCGEDATSDVIVDADGNVLSILCYPNSDYEVVVVGGDSPAVDPVLGNKTVIVLDGDVDGADVEGDLTIAGNNVIVYGQGPDTSVISGNLAIDKNNAIVRGVRIQGDVTITKNGAALVYCVIEGDLEITGNNVSFALCEVWGEVRILGNNAVFVSNVVSGDQPISGVNLRCNDNFRFVDSDDDGVVDEDEVGESIACESRDDVVVDDPNLMP